MAASRSKSQMELDIDTPSQNVVRCFQGMNAVFKAVPAEIIVPYNLAGACALCTSRNNPKHISCRIWVLCVEIGNCIDQTVCFDACRHVFSLYTFTISSPACTDCPRRHTATCCNCSHCITEYWHSTVDSTAVQKNRNTVPAQVILVHKYSWNTVQHWELVHIWYIQYHS